MLPTPEITRLVEQDPLDPGRRAGGPCARTPSSSNAGSSGSRAMCAISGGSSAPPAETARPPNIRWSTNRSSAPPSSSAKRTRRCFSGTAVGAAAPAADRSSRGGRGGRRRCRAAARGTCRAAGRRRPAGRPGPRRSRPARPGDGAPDAGGAPRRRRSGDRPRAASRPRRTTSTSGSSGTGGQASAAGRSTVSSGDRDAAAGRRRRARGRPSRRPAARPPSWTGPRRGRTVAADAHLGGEGLGVVGAVVLDDVLRHAEGVLGATAPAGWSSSPGRRRARPPRPSAGRTAGGRRRRPPRSRR